MIHSLKLVDNLNVQADNTWYNFYLKIIENDQEILQSMIIYQLMAPRGKYTREHSKTPKT